MAGSTLSGNNDFVILRIQIMQHAARLEGLKPALRGEKLTKTYGSGAVAVHALRDVDVDIYPGEIIVLLGASGSGKSTLLNILGGLDQPTSGQVFFEDHDLTNADEHDLTLYRRDHVGFVFQFYNLIPSLTAKENVELGD